MLKTRLHHPLAYMCRISYSIIYFSLIHSPFFHSLTYRTYGIIFLFYIAKIYQGDFLIISHHMTPNGMWQVNIATAGWTDSTQKQTNLEVSTQLYSKSDAILFSLSHFSNSLAKPRRRRHDAILFLSLGPGTFAHFLVLCPLNHIAQPFLILGPGELLMDCLYYSGYQQRCTNPPLTESHHVSANFCKAGMVDRRESVRIIRV